MTDEESDTHDFWRYGAYPQQVQGYDTGRRPFYFRARNGDWQLWRGPVGAQPDYLKWADHKELLAEGPDHGLSPDVIDELQSKHLGSGWTRAE